MGEDQFEAGNGGAESIDHVQVVTVDVDDSVVFVDFAHDDQCGRSRVFDGIAGHVSDEFTDPAHAFVLAAAFDFGAGFFGKMRVDLDAGGVEVRDLIAQTQRLVV